MANLDSGKLDYGLMDDLRAALTSKDVFLNIFDHGTFKAPAVVNQSNPYGHVTFSKTFGKIPIVLVMADSRDNPSENMNIVPIAGFTIAPVNVPDIPAIPTPQSIPPPTLTAPVIPMVQIADLGTQVALAHITIPSMPSNFPQLVSNATGALWQTISGVTIINGRPVVTNTQAPLQQYYSLYGGLLGNLPAILPMFFEMIYRLIAQVFIAPIISTIWDIGMKPTIQNMVNDSIVNPFNINVITPIKQKITEVTAGFNNKLGEISTAIQNTSITITDGLNKMISYIYCWANKLIADVVTAVNRNTAAFNTGIETLINGTKDANGVTVPDSGIIPKINKAVAEAIGALYRLMGMARNVIMTPAQTKNITMTGFDVMLMPNVTYHWVAIALD